MMTRFMKRDHADMLSKVRRVGVGWLVLLTLTACTLPASAWAVPIGDDRAESADGQAPLAGAEPATDDEQSTPASLTMAPAPDVWDGASARLSAGRLALGLTIAMPAGITDHDHRPKTPTAALASDASIASINIRESWLCCRHAHAPPLREPF
jgi:hypothetical protein